MSRPPRRARVAQTGGDGRRPDACGTLGGERWGAPPSDPQLLTPDNQAQAKAIVDAMPRYQRRQLLAQMRAEGPDAVFRRV